MQLLEVSGAVRHIYIYAIRQIKVNLSQLNFKIPTVTKQWQCVQTSVYPLTAVTEVARLILKCTLTDRPPNQPLPELQFCLTYLVRKEYSVSCRHLITPNLVLFSIPFNTKFQYLNLNLYRYKAFSTGWFYIKFRSVLLRMRKFSYIFI